MKPIYLLLVVAFGALAIAGYVVYSRDVHRPHAEVVHRAKQALAQANDHFEAVKNAPLLPAMQDSWIRVRSEFEDCDLNFSPDNTPNPDTKPYGGPANAWRAVVKGNLLGVIACAWRVTSNYPVIPDAITVNSDGVTTLNISILGALEESSL